MKNIRFLLLLSVFSLCSTESRLQAQQTIYLIKASALEEGNKAPMPYAGVSLKWSALQTTADEQGFFKLALLESDLNDTVIISFIGFEKKRISVKELLKNPGADNVPVFVKRSNIELPAVVIKPDRSASEVLQMCVNNADFNYNPNLFALKGMYRQLHRENGIYCRLIEADVQVAFKSTSARENIESAEMFLVQHLRKSNVTERNGYTHGDHLSDLFRENPIRYNQRSFFNSDNLEFFHIAFDSTHAESDSLYFLKIKSKNLTNKKHMRIYLQVLKHNFAITQLIIEETPSQYYDKAKARDLSNWDFQTGRFLMQFKKQSDNFYYPTVIEQYYNHYVLNNVSKYPEYLVEEWFSFYAEKSPAQLTVSRDPNFKNFGDLYLKKYSYDEAFWNEYALLKAHPLLPAALKDLQLKEPLSLQFYTAGE